MASAQNNQNQIQQQRSIADIATEITKNLTSCTPDALAKIEDPLLRNVELSRGVFSMQQLLTQQVVEQLFMPMMGLPIGFLTDKDKEPPEKQYQWRDVRDFAIEALSKGFYLINNEVNLIAGRCYVAQNGIVRKVEELVTELEIDLSVPHIVGDKGALVAARAYWKQDGRQERLVLDQMPAKDGLPPIDKRLVIRVNSGMGADGILGKAKRKLYAAIYEYIRRGSRWLPNVGDVLETTGEAVVEGQKAPGKAAQSLQDLTQQHQQAKDAANGATGASGSAPATSAPTT